MQGSEENFCAGVISTVITWEGGALETLEKSVKYVPVETLEKGVKYVQNSGVFIIKLWTKFRPFLSVSIVHYEQINICQELFSCVNIITKSLKMSKCFI